MGLKSHISELKTEHVEGRARFEVAPGVWEFVSTKSLWEGQAVIMEGINTFPDADDFEEPFDSRFTLKAYIAIRRSEYLARQAAQASREGRSSGQTRR